MENKTLDGGYFVSYDVYPKGEHISVSKGFIFFVYEEDDVKNSKIERLNEFNKTIKNIIEELPDVKSHIEKFKKNNIEAVIIFNSISKIL